MRQIVKKVWSSILGGDKILLLLCLMTSCLGCLAIASATSHHETLRYVVIQIVAIVLGVSCYVIVSSIDLEFISEHRMILVIFNIVLLLLLIPFGVSYNSGNTSWLEFPFLPFAIQPAEICKIIRRPSVPNNCQSYRDLLPRRRTS